MNAEQFRADINGLRALSVVLVVLFHFRVPGFGGGFIGVDVFFVISGYLMTRIIATAQATGTFDYLKFLKSRANRIFPALLALLLTLLALAALALPPLDLSTLAEQTIAAALFYSNAWFRERQGYFAAGKDELWLLHTWSLSVEWQFYMLYPLLLIVGGRLSRLRAGVDTSGLRAAGPALVVLLVFVPSLLWCIYAKPDEAFFSLTSRAWEFLAGALVFLTEGSRRFIGARTLTVLGRIGIASIVLANFVIDAAGLESVWPGAYALMPVGGAVLVIWCGGNHFMLDNKVSQRLGTWSYSIYLWHWPIVVALAVTGVGHSHPGLAVLAGVALSIAMGALSFRFIETRRSVRGVGAWLSGAKVAVSMCAVALLASAVHASDGLMFRVGRDQAVHRALLAAAVSKSTPDNCIEALESPENRRSCTLLAGASGPQVLVLGDSHAEHLYAWFERHARVRTQFMLAFGCPIVPGFDRPSRPSWRCSEYADQAFRAAASGRFDTVIISANWPGFSPSGDATDLCQVSGDAACVPIGELPDAQAPVQAFESAVQALMERGIDVVVIDGTPTAGQSVPHRLAREQYWRGRMNYAISLQSLMRKNRDFDRLFARLRGRQHWHLVSLRPEFCDEQRCELFDRVHGYPVFKDRDHFNPPWIRDHGRALLPFVQPERLR